jgi:hypothetical protein
MENFSYAQYSKDIEILVQRLHRVDKQTTREVTNHMIVRQLVINPIICCEQISG